MDEKLSWVYMTCGSLDEARKLGQVLLEKNLAACVNILDGMRSLYRWEGAVQEDQETVLIAKTRHELMDELTKTCLLYTSPSPRDPNRSRMPSSA